MVIGHSEFFESLTSSMASGRMHHAWLLTGPSGIGKATVARLAAAWLLSERVNTRDLFGAEVAGFSVCWMIRGPNWFSMVRILII